MDKTKKIKHDTEKQRKLKEIILKNAMAIGSTKSMVQMMIEAGYSQQTAMKQTKILKHLDSWDIVARLEKERDRAVKAMSKKIGKAKYRDITDAIDKLTKNIQLLSGGKTGNEDITFKWEQ